MVLIVVLYLVFWCQLILSESCKYWFDTLVKELAANLKEIFFVKIQRTDFGMITSSLIWKFH